MTRRFAKLAALLADPLVVARRFPLSVAMLALGTLVMLAVINDLVGDPRDLLTRIGVGLLVGALFAAGGALFAESRPQSRILSALVAYIVPLICVGLFALGENRWVTLPILPILAILWTSVAAFTAGWRGAARVDAQNRYWWFNHRLVTTGGIAVLALGIVALGLLAIQASLSLLFGLNAHTLFLEFLLPLVSFFLTPLYWLSTVPRLEEYRTDELQAPEFLSRAIGFLGQFVLTPLLLAYALILLAYGVQIVLRWELPQGVLGWMALAFFVTGMANWLVLHPPFLAERRVVRLFLAAWPFLLIVPLLLFAVAVSVRINAYGLTPERIMLIVGGLWTLLITIALLLRRGDIRLVAGLAGLLLLVLAVGPLTPANLSIADQVARLDAALAASKTTDGFAFSSDSGAMARGAVNFLGYERGGDVAMNEVLARHGVAVPGVTAGTILMTLGLTDELGEPATPRLRESLLADLARPYDVSATPVVLGYHYVGQTPMQIHGLWEWQIAGSELIVIEGEAIIGRTTLPSFTGETLPRNVDSMSVDVTAGGIRFQLGLETVEVRREDAQSPWMIETMGGRLYATGLPPSAGDAAPVVTPLTPLGQGQ